MRYPQRRTPFLTRDLVYFFPPCSLWLSYSSPPCSWYPALLGRQTPRSQPPSSQRRASASSAGNAQETDPELPSGESGESLESGDSQPVSQPAPDGPIQLVFTDSQGYKLPYCLYLPADMEEGVSYPLVLFLHGAGERGSGNLAQTNDTGIIPSLTEAAFYAEAPLHHPGSPVP